MNVLIRCNAGDKYGLGHLSRCSAIAFSLFENKQECFFLIKTDNKSKIIDFLKTRNISSNKFIFISERIS
ncbi:MAG: hypothetical protein JXR58_12950, partial [Bacteroidales bacterium]|nr:hypothetical protein [Bacteroidales bacterium]